MKQMKKIIMTSLLLCSHSVFAMQALDDGAMSQTTGQDGITLTLTTPGVSARLIWHDNDGWADRAIGANAGSLSFGDGTAATNFRTNGGSTVINLDADGGTGVSATNGPVLNVAIVLPSNLEINTGNVYISKRDGTGALVNSQKIMNDMKVDLHGLELNVQLGSEPQGNMINISGSIVSGLRIHDFALLDGSASGSGSSVGIGASLITMKDSGGSNLSINKVGVDVDTTGLVIGVADLNGGNGIDVQMQDFRLGDLSTSAVKMGDAELRGIKLDGAMLTVRGH